ncbi:Gigaxonin [Bienertia sinuspersici]
MMVMDQLPPHGGRRGWKRRRTTSRLSLPSADAEDLKDICACVRFTYDSYPRETLKCLRLKIPGILIRKIEEASCFSSSGSSISENADLPHYHQSDMEVYPSTHHLEQENCIDKVVLQRYVTCKLDPVFNGPFIFPFPHGTRIRFARCASIGSVVFTVGGYDDHFDHQARQQVFSELAGFHPTQRGSSLPRQLVTGSPITGGKRLNPSPPKPPPTCTSDNTCYHFQYCDFSKPDPQWQMSSQALVSPRILPRLISLQGMLFAFGGNCPSDLNAPFAEAFDPNVGYWEPLPKPPFGRLGLYELYVFPLPKCDKILVAGTNSGIRYTFDLSTWCWHPFEPALNQGFDMLDSLQVRTSPSSFPVLSVFDKAIYWIDSCRRLCVYNYVGDGKYYEGSISGLHYNGRDLVDEIFTSVVLLPLSKHLLGLLWFSREWDIVSFNHSSVFHLSIVHVSFPSKIDIEYEDEDVEGFYAAALRIPLTASAVACLSFPLEGTDSNEVIDACLL